MRFDVDEYHVALLDRLFKVTHNGAEEKAVFGVGRKLLANMITPPS
ncbi:hypothetical protein BKA03_000441 [Demequina lutea]|uniref:Uncharacterized protein n=1 Tax=Demequina lutea TaxID=431489 RepID=A0A7Z0CJ33_9MICO|nr:hypothetical protein [Demequina lutea]